MKEIRLHGRAGQGMVTGAELIALAAHYEGKHSQAFPFFGSEKRGPPVEAYCRIDDKPFLIHEEIAQPDVVIVGDSSILDAVDVCKGLRADGVVIVNSRKSASDLRLNAKNVYTVNATEVALKHFKKLILNTVMLGAFCKVTGIVRLASVQKAIRESLSSLPAPLIEANVKAIEEVYNLMACSAPAAKAPVVAKTGRKRK